MQLASSGARAFGRHASHGISHGPPHSSRSIHTPAFVPRPTTKPISSTTQRIFARTRTLFANLLSHVTAPGTIGRHVNVSGAGRSMYPAPTHSRTFHQGLSFPVRYTLGRPLHSPFLPRPPAVPRGTTQIGLGTARNFSTGRPIFQSLADNVPVVGRAFWEADLQVKMMEERARIAKKPAEKKVRSKRKEMLKPRQTTLKPVAAAAPAEGTQDPEMDHYFPEPPVPEVTTYLLIPLAPTPTNRLPLPETPRLHSSAHPLLPFSLLSSLHSNHSNHALRVSSLFAKLDTSRVFDDPKVRCSAYGDPGGMCTVLEVQFEGWTEHRVRGILGETGIGWCVLEEVRREDELKECDSEIMSTISSDEIADDMWTRSTSPGVPEMHMPTGIDPSASFVLPTLDFSASFPLPPAQQSRVPTPLEDLAFHNAWSTTMGNHSNNINIDANLSDGDAFSDFDSESDNLSWSGSERSPSPFEALSRSPSPSVSSYASSDNWMGLGFSSQFASRMQDPQATATGRDWFEPREMMF